MGPLKKNDKFFYQGKMWRVRTTFGNIINAVILKDNGRAKMNATIHQLDYLKIHAEWATRTTNPFWGRQNFSTKFVRDFKYKEEREYTYSEWMENIYCVASENVAYKTQVYFHDKRHGVNFTRMYLQVPLEKQHEYWHNPDLARQFIELHWRKRNNCYTPQK